MSSHACRRCSNRQQWYELAALPIPSWHTPMHIVIFVSVCHSFYQSFFSIYNRQSSIYNLHPRIEDLAYRYLTQLQLRFFDLPHLISDALAMLPYSFFLLIGPLLTRTDLLSPTPFYFSFCHYFPNFCHREHGDFIRVNSWFFSIYNRQSSIANFILPVNMFQHRPHIGDTANHHRTTARGADAFVLHPLRA